MINMVIELLLLHLAWICMALDVDFTFHARS